MTSSNRRSKFKVFEIDLTSKVVIVDDDVADTLISAIAEPANPQYEHTIQASELAAKTTDFDDYTAQVTIGGKNNDVASRTINCILTLNGVDWAAAASSLSIDASGGASPYWKLRAGIPGAALKVGDKVGVKMWGSVANQLDYRYCTMIFTPDTIGVARTRNIVAFISGLRTFYQGAIAGVTYTQDSLGGVFPADADSFLGGPDSNVGTGTSGYTIAIAKGMIYSKSSGAAHSNGVITKHATPTLTSFGLVFKYRGLELA